ncbi:hypothetical protein [Streptomyces sp. Amel2xC10]|uniref:hypothetical protein n=1 Tax=Streptomyces sp. Amel2xC10 TaxID=1305826 RepID=UPI000A0862E6|nr:hypothetical protein [Streptomyces sp. Amel2xC10]SMF86023.1 hypothetical protein SAMN02745830_07110 [Streptomyces sp. Amel2xC10]
MPQPLTDEYLKEIQDRIIAASKAPWAVTLNDNGEPSGFGPFTWVEYPDDDIARLVADIEFAAHARVDVRNLYGEVSRQRNEIRILEARITQLERANGGARHGR